MLATNFISPFLGQKSNWPKSRILSPALNCSPKAVTLEPSILQSIRAVSSFTVKNTICCQGFHSAISPSSQNDFQAAILSRATRDATLTDRGVMSSGASVMV
ncbi:unannotated protein [freshwater metagenome]|uniref:Unannotated protein n=1 Tax=freshwater metagenome TaxID=449393 RepID=A0A6J6F0R7_9ZZZZ